MISNRTETNGTMPQRPRDGASSAPAHPTRQRLRLSPTLTPANHLAVLLCVKVGDQSVRDERDGSGGRMA